MNTSRGQCAVSGKRPRLTGQQGGELATVFRPTVRRKPRQTSSPSVLQRSVEPAAICGHSHAPRKFWDSWPVHLAVNTAPPLRPRPFASLQPWRCH